jgi:2-polyprenyl-3-methyl-5-hydroxy-6-metoxy-1,4-benzoquinol methylase
MTTTMNDRRHCPVCDTPSPRESSFQDVVLHRCPLCDHCFTDVSTLEFQGEYDEEWEALHQNWFENPNVALFEFIADTIRSYKPDAKVLDVGAGRGELLEHLWDALPQATLTGLDISLSPDVEGVEVVVDDIATVDFGDRRWDVVTSLATIEHLDDVQRFARRLKELTVPGGLVIVMTNNERSIPYDVARAARRVGNNVIFERLYDRHHLNHFNTTSLRALFQRADFDVLQLWRHNIPLAAVDMPRESTILRIGVGATFVLGRGTGRTFLQTLVLRAPSA